MRSDEAAFPRRALRHSSKDTDQSGLTKRELFTAMALQGLLASLSLPEMIEYYAGHAQKKGIDFPRFMANSAEKMADALIEVLSEDK